MLTHQEIYQSFVDFFKKKQHTVVKSASLIPQGDPSILFNNAGMNPFKDIFLGVKEPDVHRVCNAQKCIRLSGKHNDLEEVGKDTYHHAFFEMLGNWSFGDYYKKEIIGWAWELLTAVWQLPKNNLYATVYTNDDEAFNLWTTVTDINRDHVFRFGEKDNFWEMGASGPCGPCSEIHIDVGAEHCTCATPAARKQCQLPGGGVNRDCARYIEIWNLVFIQYNREENGTLTPLKCKHVDTGMGFERITAILQKKASNYETDLFMPLITALEKLTHTVYPHRSVEVAENSPQSTATATAFRVIVDHVRAISFAIADGVIPANEGRGYVIRRLIRRAYRYGKTLGLKKPFLHHLVPTVTKIMRSRYPELNSSTHFITTTIEKEEKQFDQTLDKGEKRFATLIASQKSSSTRTLSGKDIYELYDTYGFPLDLIKILADEVDWSLDEPAFLAAMEQQRQRSRSSHSQRPAPLLNLLTAYTYQETGYSGEDEIQTKASFLESIAYHPPPAGAALSEKPAISTQLHLSSLVQYNKTDADLWLLFTKTPFYAESGGQIGDSGWIFALPTPNAQPTQPSPLLRITDTQRFHKYTLLKCDMPASLAALATASTESLLTHNEKYLLRIDNPRKEAIRKNHSATHLLHAALCATLGSHIRQQGSLITAEKLRFDFNHPQPISAATQKTLENFVATAIQTNLNITIRYENKETALAAGAKAFFEDKYGATVRVVRIAHTTATENVSIELCGGSHVKQTQEIGGFKIIAITSIGAGIKRIEALTGPALIHFYEKHHTLLTQTSQLLQTSLANLPQKVAALLKENQTLRDSRHHSEHIAITEKLKSHATPLPLPPYSPTMPAQPSTFYTAHFKNKQPKYLTHALDAIKKADPQSIILITHEVPPTPPQTTPSLQFWVGVGQALQNVCPAQLLINEIKIITNGKGGGSAGFAQGSAPTSANVANLPHAIKKAAQKHTP